MHLFNNYSLISIPRVVEIISVELKRNCLVWTGIHVANVVQFAPSPVKIYYTSVSTVGHYRNKASGLGLYAYCFCYTFYNSRCKNKSVNLLHPDPSNFKDWWYSRSVDHDVTLFDLQ